MENYLFRNYTIRTALEDIKWTPPEKRQEYLILLKEQLLESGVRIPTNETLAFLLGEGSIRDVLENTTGNF